MNRPNIIINILIGLMCGSLGFGVSQMAMASEVREHGVEIRNIKQAFDDERERTDARIFELAGLIKSVLGQNAEREKTMQELIQVLKVQNELLNRKL